MPVQIVQSHNVAFGTRFSQGFFNELEKTIKNKKMHPNIEKNIKDLLEDGLDEVTIATKTVEDFWSGKNREVFYVKSNRLEQLIKKAKDDKEFYSDEQYYAALKYLQETAQIDSKGRNPAICGVKSIKGQNFTLYGSSDRTSSMIYALLRQAGRNVNTSVDGESTCVRDGAYNFWYNFKNADFANKFKTIYNEVVKNYEILVTKLEQV